MITPYCIICGSIDISTVTVQGDGTYIACHDCETQYTQTGRDVLGTKTPVHDLTGRTHLTKREFNNIECVVRIIAWDIQHLVYYAEICTGALAGELISLQASMFDR